MSSFEQVANEFVKFYYDAFDTDPAKLRAAYRDSSMLSYEAEGTLGVEAIVEKLSNLKFGRIQHRTDTTDAQPVGEEGVLVMVTGALLIEGQERPWNFSQTFQLRKDEVSWWVYNDIFRLVFPAA